MNLKPNNMTIKYYVSTDSSKLDTRRIHSWLRSCFWSKDIPLEYVERFIRHSLCFGAYKSDGDLLIGFGRVVSDFTTYAYICDVVVEETNRQKGIGTAILNAMFDHPELQGLKTWSLKTTEQARKIYERKGFCPVKEHESLLEIDDINIYTHQSFVSFFK